MRLWELYSNGRYELTGKSHWCINPRRTKRGQFTFTVYDTLCGMKEVLPDNHNYRSGNPSNQCARCVKAKDNLDVHVVTP